MCFIGIMDKVCVFRRSVCLISVPVPHSLYLDNVESTKSLLRKPCFLYRLTQADRQNIKGTFSNSFDLNVNN